MSKTYSAAVIGSTGKGGYGHRLDTAFAIDGVELVAIADHDPEGLAEAGERLGISRRYRDYRQMLEDRKTRLRQHRTELGHRTGSDD